MKIILASNNKNKAREIKAILGDRFELYTMADFGLDIEIEETGSTFEENAYIKASTVAKLTRLPSLADDSGLMVDALGGAPGVYSARYAGEEHDDNKNIDKLLANLKGIDNRKAKFVTHMTTVFSDGTRVDSDGEVEGIILEERHGYNGFGYDPIFYSTELEKTFAEADGEEKNKISHRKRALENMLKILAIKGE